MRKIPLPRIGMRTIKTAVAVTLSYLIFVPFGLLYNENYPGVLGYIGPLYACIPCVVCMQSSLEQTFQVGLSRFLGVLVGAVIGALMILIPEAVFSFWLVKAAMHRGHPHLHQPAPPPRRLHHGLHPALRHGHFGQRHRERAASLRPRPGAGDYRGRVGGLPDQLDPPHPQAPGIQAFLIIKGAG